MRPEGGAVAIDFSAGEMRFSLLLVRKNGALYAYENLCPHAHYPLERPDGRVVCNKAVTSCARRMARVDAETGGGRAVHR